MEMNFTENNSLLDPLPTPMADTVQVPPGGYSRGYTFEPP